MGEYAKRKSDGQEIKIGTCESMYYLRLEDKDKVTPDRGSGFGWYWRVPFPDEDNILPGEYENHNRAQRLYAKKEGQQFHEDFTDPETAADPGTFQMSHKSGLLLSVPCYHGEKLPEVHETSRAGWNGKSWFLELRFIRTDQGAAWPVVGCQWCGKMWRYDWPEILPYLHGELKTRCEVYANNNGVVR